MTMTSTRGFPWGPVVMSLAVTCIYSFTVFGYLPIVAQFFNMMVCEHRGYVGHCNDPEITGEAANVMRIFEILQYGSATLALGTLGSLSDYRGRKLLLFIPVVGKLVETTLGLVCISRTYDQVIIIGYFMSVFNGLCGSYGSFLMSIYAYGADLTRGDLAPHRARLYALITGAVGVGNMLGPIISGWLLQNYGYYTVTSVYITLSCLALIIIFFMRESWDPSERPPQPFQLFKRHNTFVILYQFLSDHVSTHKGDHAVNATASGTKDQETSLSPRTGRRAAVGRRRDLPLSLLAVVFFFFFGDLVGQGVIFVFYAKTAFGMSPKHLGYYDSLLGASKAATSFIVLPVIYSFLTGPANDFAFCFFGMACNVSYFLILALVPYQPLVWAAIPLNGLSQMTFPHLRSLFSRSVAEDMQGRLFAVMSAIETLSTTITPIIVAPVFKHTAQQFVGAVWFVMVGFVVIAFLALYAAYLISLTKTPSSNAEEEREWRKDSADLTRELLGSEVEEEGRGASSSVDSNGEPPPPHV